MWFFLSLIFAFATAIGTSIAKHVLKDTDVLVYIAFSGFFALIVMAIVIVLRPIPALDSIFFLAVAAAASLNIASSIISFYAIKIAPISLLAPFSSFHPVFATLFGFLLLGEHIDGRKLFAVALIVFGTYLLQVMDIKKDLLAPFRSLFQNRAVTLTILANMLWGVTPVFEKTAIAHTHPSDGLITVFAEGAVLTSVFFPLMLVRSKSLPAGPLRSEASKAGPFGQFKRHMWWYIIPAPFGVLAAWSAFTAFSLSNIGIVTAVFKLSVLFTILFGAIFFKEERIGERFLGAGVMLVGTVLLVI